MQALWLPVFVEIQDVQKYSKHLCHKPTGQGTGNDIVKAHGGEIKVETKEGEGTVFSIRLPY